MAGFAQKFCERNGPGIFMLSCIGRGLITHVRAHPPAAPFAVGQWTGIWLFFGSQLRQETHNRFSRKLLPETLHILRSRWCTEYVNSMTNLGIAHLSVRALWASSSVYPEKGKNHCIMSVKDIVSKGKLGHECCRGDVFWVQTCSLCLQDAQLYVSARPQNIVGLCSGRS